jgi:hypothetical protein
MSRGKKVFIVMVVFGAISIIYLTWYSAKHSMDEAQAFEVNAPGQLYRVLIATQGSKFKDAVVQKVVAHFKELSIHIKVVDVGQLPQVNEGEWSALVILHTWENFSPQEDVETFLSKSMAKNKIVVVATSGSGTEMMEGVDGITSASEPEEVEATASEIIKRVMTILNVV